MMMVVEKPGVDVALAQRGLDGGEVHGQTTILNKCSDFANCAWEGLENYFGRDLRPPAWDRYPAQTASTRPNGHAP